MAGSRLRFCWSVHSHRRRSSPRGNIPLASGLAVCLSLLASCGSDTPEQSSAALLPDASCTDCSSESNPPQTVGTATGSNSPTTEEAIISVPAPNGTGSPGVSPNGQECQRDTYEAKRTELNLLLLIDLSGSMLSQVDLDTGETQWEAVRQAVREFVTSPAADGLGLSITYYPILSERTACESGTFCDDGSLCLDRLCAIPTLLGFPAPCGNDADCLGEVTFDDGSTLFDRCMAPFTCVDYALQLCFVDDNCPNGDVCDEETEVGVCPGTMSCNATDYASPTVPLQILPAGRDALVASLDDSYVDFYSATPTHVALEGAFSQVRQWRADEPDKRSVVVLATDGIPEGCAAFPEQDLLASSLLVIDQAAQDDLNTFVIGVMPMADESVDGLAEHLALQRSSLEAMAQAGQTTAPFLIQADTSTTQAFLEALDEVRSVALVCDYALPEGTADFNLVNVEMSTEGAPQTIPKVDTPTECANGGWYYDSDATTAEDAPSRVVLCESTCAQVREFANSRVDVVLGCPTIRQVL